MLVLTAENPELFARAPEFASWPGPACLCVLPDQDLTADDISHAEERFLVFDFLPAPPGRMVMLRAIVLRLARRGPLPEGPLLFVAGTPEDTVFEDAARSAAADPFVIEAQLNPATGVLERLLLGTGIMKNPLLLTFFRNMEPEIEEPYNAGILEVLKEHLVCA